MNRRVIVAALQWLGEWLMTGRPRHTLRYKTYIVSDAWQVRRKEALKAANYTCQHCGATGVTLQCHHRSYERLGHESPADLVVLCLSCHKRADRERRALVRRRR